MGKATNNGKTIYVRKGETKDDAKKRYEEKSKPKQVPTKAKIIENMNEAQLDIEIAKQQRIIDSADRAMGNIPRSENIGAIPLGQTTRGKTQAQIDKIIERSTSQAKKYTDAYEKKKSAERTLKNLQKAKKEVTGTGKTQKELKEETKKKMQSSTKQTLQWKMTSKGGWENGGYFPKVIKAGSLEIHGSNGFYSIYKDGKLKMQGINKLATAKTYAEKLK